MRFREDQESPVHEPDRTGWLHGKLGRKTGAGEEATATYLGAGAPPPKSPRQGAPRCGHAVVTVPSVTSTNQDSGDRLHLPFSALPAGEVARPGLLVSN